MSEERQPETEQIQMDALKRLRRILESEGFTEDAMFG